MLTASVAQSALRLSRHGCGCSCPHSMAFRHTIRRRPMCIGIARHRHPDHPKYSGIIKAYPGVLWCRWFKFYRTIANQERDLLGNSNGVPRSTLASLVQALWNHSLSRTLSLRTHYTSEHQLYTHRKGKDVAYWLTTVLARKFPDTHQTCRIHFSLIASTVPWPLFFASDRPYSFFSCIRPAAFFF